MTLHIQSEHPDKGLGAASQERLAVITVTYHPDVNRLAQQFRALPRNALIVLVDNASDEEEVSAIKQLVRHRAQTCLLENSRNIGLAAAINRGVEYAARFDPTREFLLLMDQDSLPVFDSVGRLMAAFHALEAKGSRVGSVGPRLIDEATGMEHGFHCARRWYLRRIFPAEDSVEAISCINLNGSGTLVRTALFQQLGGLDATFFIDHVDTDWAFRVLAAGYDLFGIPEASFVHQMGDKTFRFWWFGWRVWPYRKPLRHYYLFRNAIRLVRRRQVPRVWKFWVVVKLALTIVVHGIFDSQRGPQIRHMLRGIKEGMLVGKSSSSPKTA